jgi:hypothetical protein
MVKKFVIPVTAVFVATVISGCVITVRESHDHYPDRCYDCHYSWELDKLSAENTCAEFEITMVSDGFWYKPVGTDDTQKKFHLLAAHESGTVLGSESQ